MDTDEDTLTALFRIAKDVFSEWNLQINEAKTEYVHFRIADRDELMEDGKHLSEGMKNGVQPSY